MAATVLMKFEYAELHSSHACVDFQLHLQIRLSPVRFAPRIIKHILFPPQIGGPMCLWTPELPVCYHQQCSGRNTRCQFSMKAWYRFSTAISKLKDVLPWPGNAQLGLLCAKVLELTGSLDRMSPVGGQSVKSFQIQRPLSPESQGAGSDPLDVVSSDGSSDGAYQFVQALFDTPDLLNTPPDNKPLACDGSDDPGNTKRPAAPGNAQAIEQRLKSLLMMQNAQATAAKLPSAEAADGSAIHADDTAPAAQHAAEQHAQTAVPLDAPLLEHTRTRLLGERGDLLRQVETALLHVLLCSQTDLLLIKHGTQHMVSLTPVRLR